MAKQPKQAQFPRIELIDTPSPLASRESLENYRRNVEAADMAPDERDQMLAYYHRVIARRQKLGWPD
jgi:hypothetical protein